MNRHFQTFVKSWKQLSVVGGSILAIMAMYDGIIRPLNKPILVLSLLLLASLLVWRFGFRHSVRVDIVISAIAVAATSAFSTIAGTEALRSFVSSFASAEWKLRDLSYDVSSDGLRLALLKQDLLALSLFAEVRYDQTVFRELLFGKHKDLAESAFSSISRVVDLDDPNWYSVIEYIGDYDCGDFISEFQYGENNNSRLISVAEFVIRSQSREFIFKNINRCDIKVPPGITARNDILPLDYYWIARKNLVDTRFQDVAETMLNLHTPISKWALRIPAIESFFSNLGRYPALATRSPSCDSTSHQCPYVHSMLGKYKFFGNFESVFFDVESEILGFRDGFPSPVRKEIEITDYYGSEQGYHLLMGFSEVENEVDVRTFILSDDHVGMSVEETVVRNLRNLRDEGGFFALLKAVNFDKVVFLDLSRHHRMFSHYFGADGDALLNDYEENDFDWFVPLLHEDPPGIVLRTRDREVLGLPVGEFIQSEFYVRVAPE